jgi:hypothetical protein
MQPTSHAAMSGGLASGPERGGWCGPERSDYTAAAFRPQGLALTRRGPQAPRNKGSFGHRPSLIECARDRYPKGEDAPLGVAA